VADAADASRGVERKGAHKLEEWQILDWSGLAGSRRERARAVALPGDVRRNCESLADSFAPGRGENHFVARGKCDHLGQLRPGEARIGQMARAVDRVAWPELLRVEPLGPARRIVVQPDGTARAADIQMVGQREILKPEVPRDFGEGLRQCLLGFDASDFADKRLYSIEHAELQRQPACSKSRCSGCIP
jgi:hypothetical protein